MKKIKELSVKQVSKLLDEALTTFPPNTGKTVEVIVRIIDTVIERHERKIEGEVKKDFVQWRAFIKDRDKSRKNILASRDRRKKFEANEESIEGILVKAEKTRNHKRLGIGNKARRKELKTEKIITKKRK